MARNSLERELVARHVERMRGDEPVTNPTDSTKTPKPSGRRVAPLRKASCQGCGMPIRVTRVWLKDVGLPTCACGGSFRCEHDEDQALVEREER